MKFSERMTIIWVTACITFSITTLMWMVIDLIFEGA